MVRSITVTVGKEQVQLRLNDRIYLYKDSWESKRHSNAEFELHMVLKGSCRLEIGSRAYLLTARSAVIVPPGQYHMPQQLPGEFERFTMSFSLGQGALYAALAQPQVVAVSSQTAQLCQAIFRESRDAAPFRREMLQAQLVQLLLQVFRVLQVVPAEEDSSAEETGGYIQAIDDFFELHMGDSAGAEELAASLHLSRRQLARILQKTYGMGFREKRIRTRMEHAAWLLRNTDVPVSQVAQLVGYASETAFYQAFQTQFGQTPAQYRRTVSADNSSL